MRVSLSREGRFSSDWNWCSQECNLEINMRTVAHILCSLHKLKMKDESISSHSFRQAVQNVSRWKFSRCVMNLLQLMENKMHLQTNELCLPFKNDLDERKWSFFSCGNWQCKAVTRSMQHITVDVYGPVFYYIINNLGKWHVLK